MPGEWNDEVSSWRFCNNMSARKKLTVKLYWHNDYLDQFNTASSTFEVTPGECLVRNTEVNDELSSYKVSVSDP